MPSERAGDRRHDRLAWTGYIAIVAGMALVAVEVWVPAAAGYGAVLVVVGLALEIAALVLGEYAGSQPATPVGSTAARAHSSEAR